MTNLYTRYTRRIAAAVAAIAIVGLTGLTLDRGHEGMLPKGVIEIGELEVQSVGELNVAVLPAIEVIGRREVLLADTDANDDGSQG